MFNKSIRILRVLVLLVLLTTLIPINQSALAATPLPPVDMFQLPWDQGVAWMAIDGIDNGSKRPVSSSHHYSVGGAIDFAPRANMVTGEDTSNFWVAAAAAGVVIERSACHVRLAHEGGWITEYQFLGLVQVQIGDAVTRNQRLGIIADGVRYRYCSGYQEPNTPHLHFMLRPTLVGATLAGWQVKYSSFWNTTTFTKDGTTVGLYRPLLNVPLVLPTATPPATLTTDPSQLTPTPVSSVTNTPDPSQGTATSTPDGQATNTPDPSQATATPTLGGGPTNTPDPSQATVTPTPAGELTATPTPAGNLTLTPTPSGPYVSTTVSPETIGIGETSHISVLLHNVPASGFTSGEFTCTYNPALVEANNISITNLFGEDAVSVINGPQNGTFIVAIAGANGNKAITDGHVFIFELQGLQAGQTTVDCSARISQGDNTLTPLPALIGALTITSAPSTPTFTPTVTGTPSNGWLTLTNLTYGFQFQYPAGGEVASGSDDTFTRIDLPFTAGTNLGEKYLEVIPALNPTVCQSPLATQSMLQTSESVVINGLPFLKQTGSDAGAGNLYQWVAYSTSRDNVCVSLDFILHSHNPGNFATPPPVFDYAAESAVFQQMVETYAWLAQNPTATPTVPAGPIDTPTPAPTSTLSASPTPTALPFGMLTGQVLASKPVTLNLYNLDDTLAASMSANPDGTFAFTVSAGEYKVVAAASGYLSAQASVTVASGNTTTLPTITLPAGDIDGNNVIDQFDALTIGMSYNTAMPAEADLNNDGVINVLDLEMLALHYRKTGPVVWE